MQRTVLGIFGAAFLSGSAAAQSDSQQPSQPTHAEQVQHWAESATQTQLKTMKTSLRLSSEQEALWAPFESAVEDGARARVISLQKEQSGKLSPMDLNLAKADRLAQSQANLKAMVDAAKPLYDALDNGQKQKFVTMGRMLVPERGQFVKAMRRLH